MEVMGRIFRARLKMRKRVASLDCRRAWVGTRIYIGKHGLRTKIWGRVAMVSNTESRAAITVPACPWHTGRYSGGTGCGVGRE